MVLSTHAIIGSAMATLMPTFPLTGFVLACVSHFATDAIPHWDYKLRSKNDDESNFLNDDMQASGRDFMIDLAKIGLDLALGFALSILIWGWWFGLPLTIILLGAVGGVLPDFLQFAYFKIRREPLTSLQRFHHWIHAKLRLKGRFVLGPILQALIVIIFIVLNYYVRM